jgi:DNA-binding transcriptional LysR family regulator
MLPDFNRLKVFYYVYKSRSVLSASRELFVSQSAISQSVIALERELENKLFIRSHHRLIPTPSGKELFSIISPFIENLEAGLSDIDKSKRKIAGTLKIGSAVEFGIKFLVPKFVGFKDKYPDVSFELQLGHPNVLFPLLKEGELDFAFVDIFSKSGEIYRDNTVLKAKPVFREKLVLLSSPQYLKGSLGGKISFEGLQKCRFIDYHRQAFALKTWFRHHFAKSPQNPNVVLNVENVSAVINAIKSGLGMGVAPLHRAEEDIAGKKLVIVKTKKAEKENVISLISLKNKNIRPIETAFLKYFTP